MPFRYDPPGFRVLGNRWDFLLTTTADETSPLSLAGATISAAIGVGPGSAPMITKTSPHADVVIDPDQTGAGKGKVSISFLPSETRLFPIPRSGQMAYEFRVTFGANEVDSVAYGYLHVRPSMLD